MPQVYPEGRNTHELEESGKIMNECDRDSAWGEEIRWYEAGFPRSDNESSDRGDAWCGD